MWRDGADTGVCETALAWLLPKQNGWQSGQSVCPSQDIEDRRLLGLHPEDGRTGPANPPHPVPQASTFPYLASFPAIFQIA